ncbi:hypothetical protein IM753_12055 [Moraxella sp. K127]|uniref:hypothetical protein n=1 Tax=Moraxella TaxID=475 RepID=UPI0018800CE0|nr:hypothetical protein [Moraxella sp. K127]MBE9591687.1 hypothetical protein [Moraxella sp. K127]
MALIKETAEWVENIYLIEPNDPVEGGEDGVDNRPHIELANRTAFLNKKRQEQEQKTQEIDEKVNGLTTQVNEIQVTIQNGGNNQSSGDLDTKLAQEVQDRTDGDSHLQGQIDVLKEQIKQILAKQDDPTPVVQNETVAYLKFMVVGGYRGANVTEIDKTGDIAVGSFEGGYPKSVTVTLPADFDEQIHRYQVRANALPYTSGLTSVAGTSQFSTHKVGNNLVITIPSGSYTQNNQSMTKVDYVSIELTIEVKRK